MSTLNPAPFPPFIEPQYANPRLPVFLKCMLYNQIRIDVAPALLREADWLARVKRLLAAHYRDWASVHHESMLALESYALFMADGRSLTFAVLPGGTDDGVTLSVQTIHQAAPANPSFNGGCLVRD